MKNDITCKNLFDVLLAIFFVSWVFFEVMILGNKFDILKYSEFSGRLVVIIGRMVPTIAVYMFMSVWRDVRDAGHFSSKVVECDSVVRCLVVAGLFTVLHIVLCRFFAASLGRTWLFLILAVPFGFLNAAFAEIAWSGFVFIALKDRVSFFTACMINGFLYTMYSLPLWTIEGVRDEMGEFSHYLIYCCFCALILGCAYRITGSVLVCVYIRLVLQVGAYYYSDIVFASPAVTIMLLFELLLFALAAKKFGEY